MQIDIMFIPRFLLFVLGAIFLITIGLFCYLINFVEIILSFILRRKIEFIV